MFSLTPLTLPFNCVLLPLRSWGKPCITGVADMQVDEAGKIARVNGQEIREGDFISLNGSTGEIVKGKQPLAPPQDGG